MTDRTEQFRAKFAFAGSVVLLGAALLGLVIYFDDRLNQAPPGGEFQWHTQLYDRSNPPPIGKLLPGEKYGYRGFYYLDSSYAPHPVDVTDVNSLPPTTAVPMTIYRRPFSGSVDCLIWVMGMGCKYGELQIVGEQFAIARSKFECLSQDPLKELFSTGTRNLPTVQTVREWREDYPWEFARWGLLN
jgi:hypothetical protein